MDNENKNTENEIEESNAARRLRMLGISTEEEPAEPVKKAGWLENFWYHYKGVVLVVAAFLVIIGIGVYQLINKSKPDIFLMYAGPVYFTEDGTGSLSSALCDVMPQDFNGDGEKSVSIMQALWFSDEKHEQYEAERIEQGLPSEFDPRFNADELSKIRNEFMAGTSVICILDPAVYDEISDKDIFIPLSELLGKVPDTAFDDYAVKFAETEFCKYYPVFDGIPEDTLLAIKRVSKFATYKDDAEDVQRNHNRMFVSIMSFRPPKDTEE